MSKAQQTKIRHSRDDWMQLMDDYETSGLTQREFCECQQLAYSTFCYWRKRLSSDSVCAEPAEPLVELPVLQVREQTDWRLELDLGQGVVLRLK